MICPNCNKDYRDVPKNKLPSFVRRVDDHFYMKQKRYCMVCGNCGFQAEVIAAPTGAPYLKRKDANHFYNRSRTRSKRNKRKRYS